MTNYTVNFGTAGRSLLYEDAYGALNFSFDIHPQGKKFAVLLYPVSKTIVPSEQERRNIACERVQEYLLSRGYEVKIIN